MSLGIYARSRQICPQVWKLLITITDVLITISSIFVMYYVRSGGDQEF